MNNALVIIAEGPQDTAFIYKVLIEYGFKKFDGEFKDLRTPFKEIIYKDVEANYPKDLDKTYNRILFLPYILVNGRDTNYVIIYAQGGVKNYDNLKKILWNYLFAIKKSDSELIRFLIIQDADSDINIAIKNIRDNCSSIAKEDESKKKVIQANNPSQSTTINLDFKDELSIQHCKVSDIEVMFSSDVDYKKAIQFGFYFLPGLDPNIGTLENLVLPIMEAKELNLFKDIRAFVEKVNPKFKETTSIEDLAKRVTETAKYYKTQIAIAGQFSKDLGGSSTVFYQNGLYMGGAILENKQCKEIVALVKSLLADNK